MRYHAENTAMFAIGASGYTITELLWRGHTHWTMALTGGLCAMAIRIIDRRNPKRPLHAKLVLGGAVITAAEFMVGCIVNRMLGWNVWDYSGLPYNLLGQICPQYCTAWIALTLPVLLLGRLFGRAPGAALQSSERGLTFSS